MNRRENPFTPGAGYQPPALVGRDSILEDAHVAIDRTLSGRSARGQLLCGLRGVGKTVLLNAFAQHAERAGMLSIVIEATQDHRFLATLAQELTIASASLGKTNPLSEMATRMRALLKSFTLNVNTDGSLSVGYKASESVAAETLEVDLKHLLAALGHTAHEEQQGIFLAIDELQYLSSTELGALIAATHRVAQLHLPVYVCGAGLPNLLTLAGNAKTYAERLFDYPTLGSLSYQDIVLAIRTPVEHSGAAIDDDAIDAIAQATQGYPYFVQEWGSDAWNHAQGSSITKADVESVTPIVESRLDRSFYAVRYNRATPSERQYLGAMAQLGSGPHDTGVIASVLKKKSNAVGSIRASLIDKGMIYAPEYASTAFSAPGFDRFLLRVADRPAQPRLHQTTQRKR